MANHIELQYSELETIKSKLSMINSNYLDVAHRYLSQSTDLGSSIMQAGWKFSNKEKIFSAVSDSKKRIKKIEECNQNLIGVINSIKSTYENEASAGKGNINASWLKNKLTRLGVVTMAVINPTIAAVVFSIWSGKKIISSITTIKESNKPNVNSNAKKNVTSGVSIINPNSLIIKDEDLRRVTQTVGPGGVLNAVELLKKFNEATENTTKKIVEESVRYKKLEDAMARYVNAPYVWGGSSVNGIDCSGLVMQVYKEAGIKTDFIHKASEMYKQCQPVGSYTKGNVDLNALKKGDLVFYSDGGTDAIKHVGIYVGDGNVMSAMNPSMGVVTKSINYTYRKNIYVARVAE